MLLPVRMVQPWAASSYLPHPLWGRGLALPPAPSRFNLATHVLLDELHHLAWRHAIDRLRDHIGLPRLHSADFGERHSHWGKGSVIHLNTCHEGQTVLSRQPQISYLMLVSCIHRRRALASVPPSTTVGALQPPPAAPPARLGPTHPHHRRHHPCHPTHSAARERGGPHGHDWGGGWCPLPTGLEQPLEG